VFFRPDCVPSQRSRAELAVLAREARESGIAIELVTSSSDKPAVAAFAHDVGVVERDVSVRDLSSLPVPVVPMVVVASADRKVVKVHQGELQRDATVAILASARGQVAGEP
jgi:hypothetical protein